MTVLDIPIIGICGPAQSGKDLVSDWLVRKKNFTKVAFADPIKRFAAKVFQCGNEPLWGASELRELRFTYNKDEWEALKGRFTDAATPFVHDVVAEAKVPLEVYTALLDWMISIKQRIDIKGSISMREVLQTLGTEWGRESVDPLIWVNYFYKRTVPQILSGEFTYTQEAGCEAITVASASRYKGIVVPDHRFLNEVLATKHFGGYAIRLQRLSLESNKVLTNVGIPGHSSETEMRDIPPSNFNLVVKLEEGIAGVFDRFNEIYEGQEWKIKQLSIKIGY